MFNDVGRGLDLYVCHAACDAWGAQPSPLTRARLATHPLLALPARYGQAIEVDYRGYDVSVENFLRVLTGARPPAARCAGAV